MNPTFLVSCQRQNGVKLGRTQRSNFLLPFRVRQLTETPLSASRELRDWISANKALFNRIAGYPGASRFQSASREMAFLRLTLFLHVTNVSDAEFTCSTRLDESGVYFFDGEPTTDLSRVALGGLSGGPVLVRRTDGVPMLCGIVSQGRILEPDILHVRCARLTQLDATGSVRSMPPAIFQKMHLDDMLQRLKGMLGDGPPPEGGSD
jgi:hypothetical protein